MKVLCTSFLSIFFGFEIFWWKNVGAKGLGKMLMKLTPRKQTKYSANIHYKFEF